MSGTAQYETVLGLLGLVLIEIRSSESETKNRIIADVVHNIPASIAAGRAEDEIIDHVMMRARRLDCDGYISALIRTARRRHL